MEPIIAVLPQFDIQRKRWFINQPYVQCIEKAHGRAVLVLPQNKKSGLSSEYLRNFDGYLLPGGPDANPLLFHEDVNDKCGVICEERDRVELETLAIVNGWNRPVFGVCRGVQMMNLSLGGDIYQDISERTSILHYQTADDQIPTHQVILEEESQLYSITKEKQLFVNSFHHQTIRRLGNGLQIAGTARDGMIEAIERIGHPFYIGVQWHPEHLYDWYPGQQMIWDSFIANC